MKRVRWLLRRRNTFVKPAEKSQAASIDFPEFPEEEEIKLNMKVQISFARYGITSCVEWLGLNKYICIDSDWQDRRMAVTRHGIFFALSIDNSPDMARIAKEKEGGKVKVMDYMTLCDIDTVGTLSQMQDSKRGSEVFEAFNDTPRSIKTEDKTKALQRTPTISGYRTQYMFQISTKDEENYAGRTYNIKAENRSQCDNAVSMIKDLSSRAKSRANQMNRFEKTKALVLKIYSNALFQTLATALILAVKQYTFFARSNTKPTNFTFFARCDAKPTSHQHMYIRRTSA